MNNNNLRKALEASQFYYARMYEAMRPQHERIRMEQKQILGSLYREVVAMEVSLQAMEAEFGYEYSPKAHKFNPYHDDLGRFASGPGGGDANDNGNSDTGNSNSTPSVLPKVSVPGPDGQPVNRANIFVGGAMDQSGSTMFKIPQTWITPPMVIITTPPMTNSIKSMRRLPNCRTTSK